MMPAVVIAEPREEPIAVSAQGTYGSYANSVQRARITSEILRISYVPDDDYGAGVKLNTYVLKRKAQLDDITGTNLGVTMFWTPKTEEGDFIGGVISVLSMKSSDSTSDKALIPYAAIIYKSPDLRHYFDAGYAQTSYVGSSANQVTLTSGSSLFQDWAWSQTRLYYITVTKQAQNSERVYALEERFTWYALPRELSFSLYGMLGQRIYAYDPDLQTAYSMPDVQTGSAGLTVVYNLSSSITVYGDVTREWYNDKDIADRYRATYGTLGMTFQF